MSLEFNLDENSEEEGMSRAEITEVQKKMRAKFATKLSNNHEKKILLVGGSRSGKTTLGDVICDLCEEPEELSLLSASRRPSTMIKKIDGVQMTLIDTPGLFADRKLTNDQIIEMIKNHVWDFAEVDRVIFCISTCAGIDDEQIEAIEILIALLEGKVDKFGLCITRAEDKNSNWQIQITEQILQHRRMAPLISKHPMEIMFSGCVDPGMAYNQKHLERMYENLQTMRTKVLEWIIHD